MRRLPPRHLLPPLAACLALVAGCGGGGQDPSTAGTASSPTSSSASASEPAETEATRAVEPASGLVIEEKPYRFRVPDGWRRSAGMANFIQGAYDGLDEIAVSHLPTVGAPSPADLARHRIQGSDPRLHRVDDVDIDGLPAVHLTGRDATSQTDYFTLVYLGQTVDIEFDLESGSAARRQQVVDSVLASWEWR